MSNDEQGRGYGQPGQPYPRQGREQGYQYGDSGHQGPANPKWDEPERTGGYSPYGDAPTAEMSGADRRAFEEQQRGFEGQPRGYEATPAKQRLYREDMADDNDYRQPRTGFSDEPNYPTQAQNFRDEPGFNQQPMPQDQGFPAQQGYAEDQSLPAQQGYQDTGNFGPRSFNDDAYDRRPAPAAPQEPIDKFDEYYRRNSDVMSPEPSGGGGNALLGSITDGNFQQTFTERLGRPVMLLSVITGLFLWIYAVMQGFKEGAFFGLLMLLCGWAMVGALVLLTRMVVEFFVNAERARHHEDAA